MGYLLRQQGKRQKERQRARKALRGLKKRRKNNKSKAPKNKPVSNPCPTCGSPYRGERLWVERLGQRCKHDFHKRVVKVGLLESGYYSENPEREETCSAYE